MTPQPRDPSSFARFEKEYPYGSAYLVCESFDSYIHDVENNLKMDREAWLSYSGDPVAVYWDVLMDFGTFPGEMSPEDIEDFALWLAYRHAGRSTEQVIQAGMSTEKENGMETKKDEEIVEQEPLENSGVDGEPVAEEPKAEEPKAEEPKYFDRQEVYLKEVAPKMTELHQLCDKLDIPCVISILVTTNEEGYSSGAAVNLPGERLKIPSAFIHMAKLADESGLEYSKHLDRLKDLGKAAKIFVTEERSSQMPSRLHDLLSMIFK